MHYGGLTVELVIHLLKQKVCQVEQDHLHSPKGTASILGLYSMWQQTYQTNNVSPTWPHNLVISTDFISRAKITLLKSDIYWGGIINWKCRETISQAFHGSVLLPL